MEKFINKVIMGDCLIKLKELEDNSVDSIVTDPPYELGFMGKSWDNTGIANNKEMWAECLRVLKPGGHLLAFSGTRTYHRMASAIEDAGFEVRDMIEWVYGSGFPKSLNIGVAVNKLETKEWSAIGKAIDNIDQQSIMEVWKRNSNNVKIVETQSLKLKEKAGCNTPSENFVQENVVENTNQIKLSLNVNTAEKHFIVLQAINTEENTALQNVEKIITEIKELQNLATTAGNSQPSDHAMQSMSIFTAQCDVKEWLKENTEVSHKVDEALKTLRGNKKYSNEEIINVLNAVIPSVLKHTILNQSKTFQNLDTNQKMECVSAINVIITEYTAENLISNMVDILKSKAVDKLQGNERKVTGSYKVPDIRGDAYGTMNEKQGGSYKNIEVNKTKGTSEWEGWGTALKPAHEPICMARKPLDRWWKIKDGGKKIMGRIMTVAENCLKWGTGGINIDESRVEYNDGTTAEDIKKKYTGSNEGNESVTNNFGVKEIKMTSESTLLGRFPANFIHDNSEEVRECFPETKSQGNRNGEITMNAKSSGNIKFVNHEKGIAHIDYTDSGNASRYFKSIKQPYTYKGKEYEVEGFVKSCKPQAPSNYNDEGSPARYFKSIIYQAKASKSERNKGCEGLEEKPKVFNGQSDKPSTDMKDVEKRFTTLPKANNHPTVKPIALMEYLIKMVTPKGGTCLDPFSGSFSTGVACVRNGFGFIGIEREEEYVVIGKARLEQAQKEREDELKNVGLFQNL